MSDQRNEPGSRQLIRMVNDRMWEEGYAVGVQDSMLRATQYERILTGLIAELVGDDGDGHELTPDGDACTVCRAIDRAEARLREVQGE